MSDRTRPTHVCPLCSAPMSNGPFDECRGDADKTHRPVAGIDALPYGRFLPNEEALAGRMAAAGTPIIRIAGFPAVFLMGGRPGDNWRYADSLRPETGAREYFPPARGYRGDETYSAGRIGAVTPGLLWAAHHDARQRAADRAANPARYKRTGDQTIPAAHGGAVRAGAFFNLELGRSIPPMSGGSPWAARDTGWHADGCLCRSCAAVSA